MAAGSGIVSARPRAEATREGATAYGRGEHPWLKRGAARFPLDVLMLAVAAFAAIASAPAADVPAESPGWLAAFCAIVLAVLAAWGAYRPRILTSVLEDARVIVGATAVGAMTVTFVRVLVADDPWAASQAIREWVFAATYLGAGRTALRVAEIRAWRRGEGLRPTLILGAGRVGHLIAKRLQARPERGLLPVGFLDSDPPPLGADESGLPVLGGDADLDRVVAAHGVEHAIVSFSSASHGQSLALQRRLRELAVPVSIVPRLFEDIPDRMALERLEGLPLVSIYPSDPRGWQISLKYALDRVFALLALLVLVPVLAAAALGTVLTLGRPVLYRQWRVGLDGRLFEMLKFRTMRNLADEDESHEAVDSAIARGLAPGGVEGEDRRTRLGRFLRRTSIDELPQLFNVLRGEMSLVGPRPERDRFAEQFAETVYRYGDRARMKAGMTGWAQVHGLRGQTPIADRVEWDNYYIENWSLWLDVKVLLLTFAALFRDRVD